jgi:hypothetical protein
VDAELELATVAIAAAPPTVTANGGVSRPSTSLEGRLPP